MRFVQHVPASKRVALDAVDRKVLLEYAENVRSPASAIGKRLGISRDTVGYRLERLRRAGVVQGSRAVVDISLLGFNAAHLFLQLNQPTAEAERDIIGKLRGLPQVRALIKVNGKFDVCVAVVYRDVADLDAVIGQVSASAMPYLQGVEILLVTRHVMSRALPLAFHESGVASTETVASVPVDIDRVDGALLKVLADDADAPLHVMGEKVGLSSDAVARRLRRLVSAGIIRKFVPVINYDVLGMNVYIVLMNVTGFDGKTSAMLEELLRTNPDVVWAVRTIGRYNVLVYVCTRDANELLKTTAFLRSHFPGAIREYETLINSEEFVYTYFPEHVVKGLMEREAPRSPQKL